MKIIVLAVILTCPISLLAQRASDAAQLCQRLSETETQEVSQQPSAQSGEAMMELHEQRLAACNEALRADDADLAKVIQGLQEAAAMLRSLRWRRTWYGSETTWVDKGQKHTEHHVLKYWRSRDWWMR
jgi:hypothetical protein